MKPINFTEDYKAKNEDSNIEKSSSLIVPDVTSQVAVNRGIYFGMTKLEYLSCFKKQKQVIGSELNEKKTSSLGGVRKSESNEKRTSSLGGVLKSESNENRTSSLGGVLKSESNEKRTSSLGGVLKSESNEKRTSSLGGVLKSESHLSTTRNKSAKHKIELGRRSGLPICSANVGLANKTDISNVAQERVQKILRLFQMTYDYFLKEGKEGRQKSEGNKCRADIRAAQVVEEKFGRCSPSIGAIPGVKIGDKFNFRVELALVGLHMPLQSGIGTNYSVLANPNEHRLCTSVVATGRWYENDMKDPDYLIYSGHGGFGKKEHKDQKLIGGNMALLNSKRQKNEVRVIRARVEDGKQVYVYDGLYLVENWYKVRASSGKLVFKFGLRRIPKSKHSNAEF